MRKLIAALGLIMAAPAVWAISNIENERLALPEQGLSGSFKFSADGKTGNQEKQSSEAASKIIYRADDDIVMLLLAREYGTKAFAKNTDNSFAHLRWTHLLNDHWAVETFTQWQQDEFDRLTSRTLVGGGGRYQLAERAEVYSLALGLGGFREYEKQNLISYEEYNRRWRLNSYYSYKYQLNQQLSFVNTTYYQPDPSDYGDYRVLFDLAMYVKLTGNLRLGLKYRLTHDSRPAQNFAVTPPINNFATNTAYKTELAWDF